MTTTTRPPKIQNWPLHKIGDSQFFGYVTSIGTYIDDWDPHLQFPYVEFAYNDQRTRFYLPNDKKLTRQLAKMLLENIQLNQQELGVFNKVWIELTDKGYIVDLP